MWAVRPFKVTAIRNPAELPWGHVDVIMECAGVFTAKDEAQAHLSTGAKRALISALGDDAGETIVYGVNHGTLTKDDLVVSSQRVLHHQLPVAKVLNDSIGIVRGFMTTIQNYTGDQPIAGYDAQGPLPARRKRDPPERSERARATARRLHELFYALRLTRSNSERFAAPRSRPERAVPVTPRPD